MRRRYECGELSMGDCVAGDHGIQRRRCWVEAWMGGAGAVGRWRGWGRWRSAGRKDVGESATARCSAAVDAGGRAARSSVEKGEMKAASPRWASSDF